MKIRRTVNSYEAAYYMIMGAKVIKTDIRTQPRNHKGTFNKQWVFYLTDIPGIARSQWQMGVATANVRDIESWRKKLKKALKNNM